VDVEGSKFMHIFMYMYRCLKFSAKSIITNKVVGGMCACCSLVVLVPIEKVLMQN
jgi:hypothetical protein